jgi:hypothetical protein
MVRVKIRRMKMKLICRFVVLAIYLFMGSNAFAADYDIKRMDDGQFAFSISGIKINEGSSLKRESILFNDKASPVTLASHNMSIVYKDRGFQFKAITKLNVKKNIKALQVRTILYDVFGRHMKNLSNTETKDISAGEMSINGVWRAYDNDASEFLTSVTYVARVRFENGTQWVFNKDNLHLALSSLKLEKKIGEDEKIK